MITHLLIIKLAHNLLLGNCKFKFIYPQVDSTDECLVIKKGRNCKVSYLSTTTNSYLYLKMSSIKVNYDVRYNRLIYHGILLIADFVTLQNPGTLHLHHYVV